MIWSVLYVRSMAAPAPLGNPLWGPKAADHPTVGTICPACRCPLAAGDYTTPAILGPGNDEEEQAKARAGQPYNAIALEVHWTCAGGEVS